MTRAAVWILESKQQLDLQTPRAVLTVSALQNAGLDDDLLLGPLNTMGQCQSCGRREERLENAAQVRKTCFYPLMDLRPRFVSCDTLGCAEPH